MGEMIKNPDVSVIVPMYNMEEYLDQCISSIVAQTYENIEILLIDDGSTDDTGNISLKWKEHDARINYIYQDNQGLGPARHAGIKYARGKYLAFVDSDDWVSERYIEEMYYCAQRKKADLVICDFYSAYQNDELRYAKVNLGESNDSNRRSALNNINSCSIWKTLTEKRLWDDYQIVMPALPYEDLASFPLLVILSRKIAAVDEALYFYRCGRKGSIINNNKNYSFFVDSVFWLRSEAIRLKVYDQYNEEIKALVIRNAEYLLNEARKNLDRISYRKLEQHYCTSFERVNEWKDIFENEYTDMKSEETTESIAEYKVAICIPYFDDIASLKRLLESIQFQSYKEYFVIVTDDGEDQEAQKLVESCGFRYYRNIKRLGPTANCNRAIRFAEKYSPQYIKVMHQDDYFTEKESLEALVRMLDYNPGADLAFSGTIQNDGETLFERYISSEENERLKCGYNYLLYANVIGGPSSVIVRNRSIKLDERLVWLVDVDWYIKILKCNCNYVYTTRPLIGVGIGERQVTNSCKSNIPLMLMEYAYIYYKHLFVSASIEIKGLIEKLNWSLYGNDEATHYHGYEIAMWQDGIRDRKPLVIFGAGKNGRNLIYRKLCQMGGNIVCFCDNNPDLWNQQIIDEIICLPLNELVKYGSDIYCFVSTYKDNLVIKQQLEQAKIKFCLLDFAREVCEL